MQKELTRLRSLFCHAPPPVARAAARVHDRDDKHEFREDAIDDGVRVAMKKTPPNVAEFRAAKRKAGNLRQNPISLL
jgi:hypothetical protein